MSMLFANGSRDCGNIFRHFEINSRAISMLVQQRDSDGRTPIFYSQTLQICQKLIENGSSINTGDYEEKTVLHFIKKTEILECLLDAFPKDEVRRTINKEDKFKRTPIFTCTSLTVLKLFMNHGNQ
jgi:ankyrin repeat protein